MSRSGAVDVGFCAEQLKLCLFCVCVCVFIKDQVYVWLMVAYVSVCSRFVF